MSIECSSNTCTRFFIGRTAPLGRFPYHDHPVDFVSLHTVPHSPTSPTFSFLRTFIGFLSAFHFLELKFLLLLPTPPLSPSIFSWWTQHLAYLPLSSLDNLWICTSPQDVSPMISRFSVVDISLFHINVVKSWIFGHQIYICTYLIALHKCFEILSNSTSTCQLTSIDQSSL